MAWTPAYVPPSNVMEASAPLITILALWACGCAWSHQCRLAGWCRLYRGARERLSKQRHQEPGHAVFLLADLNVRHELLRIGQRRGQDLGMRVGEPEDLVDQQLILAQAHGGSDAEHVHLCPLAFGDGLQLIALALALVLERECVFFGRLHANDGPDQDRLLVSRGLGIFRIDAFLLRRPLLS